ncbi:aldo/keto reductase [Halanaerobacter jeridensis]|uniref:Oxidoreductase n=1 Tax=Halanaerobacter jeridensis TaxID=706427 RepID=A0A938XQJ7_9FIRM|nr:aldo/keto reductase [Halanaerobacter jeridensis]MBM7555676.1 putative oxidoreductase [Halanaerobacter jeridensis]
MLDRVQLTEDFSISRLAQGFWRLADWDLSPQERLEFIESLLDLGITTFDHADIYGDYTCENLFGEALELKAELREEMELVSKCGIKLISENRPEHEIKYYDTSKEHIINSVNNSLNNLRTEYLDLLLIHRPDPLMDPDEVAETFKQLKEEGKVRNFGVSNFLPSQFEMLSSKLDFPLVTNQVEISVMNFENFDNGTIEKCQEKDVSPMAWSPLTGGKIFKAKSEKAQRIKNVLEEIKKDLNADSIAQIMYAWLLNHPAQIIPIVGSGKLYRVKEAVAAAEIELTRQQWFKIWQSGLGHPVA